jgi:hypothetical protein
MRPSLLAIILMNLATAHVLQNLLSVCHQMPGILRFSLLFFRERFQIQNTPNCVTDDGLELIGFESLPLRLVSSRRRTEKSA